MEFQVHGSAEVLLVGDDRALNAEMAAFLAAQGYAVHDAADAGEARRVLAARPIAVVVLDLSGEDAARLRRDLARANAPPVLLLSALGQDPELPAGGRHHEVAKPIRADELLARISALARDS
jgi:two-component system OmpR family response regulator